jgi:hypothetical protein
MSTNAAQHTSNSQAAEFERMLRNASPQFFTIMRDTLLVLAYGQPADQVRALEIGEQLIAGRLSSAEFVSEVAAMSASLQHYAE